MLLLLLLLFGAVVAVGRDSLYVAIMSYTHSLPWILCANAKSLCWR
jgi:hypothetical protein